jgi:hypothetical protein
VVAKEALSAAVKFGELVDAFEFVSISDTDENHAYICRSTGRIFCVSDLLDDEDDDVPEDIETSDLYIALPHRRDLGLGRNLALSFVGEELPAALNEAHKMFDRKGAYGRFKHLLQANSLLDKWYVFEQSAVEAALRDWYEAEEVALSDG